jgi:hypothetical protein
MIRARHQGRNAMSFLKQYVTTFVSALVTLVLTLITDFVLNLPRDISWLIVSIGTIITLSATLLEKRLAETASKEIAGKLKLYNLLEQLDDDDVLRLRGLELINKCESELENLAKGVLRLDRDEYYKYIGDRMSTASKYVQAIHIALELSDMYIWENEQGIVNYYRINKEAVQRRVRIERIFVLKKSRVIDASNNQVIDPRTIEILKRQRDDGIEVMIVWLESMGDSLGEEFMIFDEKEVQVQSSIPELPGRLYNLSLKRKASDVTYYGSKYSNLRAVGQPLEEFLQSI